MASQKTQKPIEKRNDSLQHGDRSSLRENYQRGVSDSIPKKGYTLCRGQV